MQGSITDEPGLNGVSVTLSGMTGAGVEVTATPGVTTGGGLYAFSVNPGAYTVTFQRPAGMNYSPKDIGSNDATDSDADRTSGVAIVGTVSSNETVSNVDAGMYESEFTRLKSSRPQRCAVALFKDWPWTGCLLTRVVLCHSAVLDSNEEFLGNYEDSAVTGSLLANTITYYPARIIKVC